MEGSTTLTVRLDPKVKKQLGRLAESKKRTKSWLAARAIADYVTRENEIIAGVKRSLVNMKTGRFIPHDEVMDKIDAVITAIASRKKR